MCVITVIRTIISIKPTTKTTILNKLTVRPTQRRQEEPGQEQQGEEYAETTKNQLQIHANRLTILGICLSTVVTQTQQSMLFSTEEKTNSTLAFGPIYTEVPVGVGNQIFGRRKRSLRLIH